MKPKLSQTELLNTWVIIPAYNEEKYLSQVIKKLRQLTSTIIVVDGGSSDATSEIAKKLNCVTVRHRVNLGKGAALKTGCEYAFSKLGAQNVIFLDGDDQHDSRLIPLFISSLAQGNEVVFGVRRLSHLPQFRLFANTMCSYLLFFLFGQYIPDIPSGFKALSKKAYQNVSWDSTNYSVEMEIAARAMKSKLKWSTVEIPTIYHDFDRGMTMLDVFSMITEVISWKFTL